MKGHPAMRDIDRYQRHTYSETRDRGRREHARMDMAEARDYARDYSRKAV
jgi:hypothetical protein